MSASTWGVWTADSEPAAEPPRLEIVPAEQGAATSVWVAVSDELTGLGGLYLTDCAISESVTPYAADPLRAERLWAISELLCGSPAARHRA
jgi:hypothetical protein